MTNVLAWLLLLVVMVAVPVVLVLLGLRGRDRRPDRRDMAMLVQLYVVRRHLDVAQFRAELKRDAAQARRELRHELDRPDQEARGR